MLTRGQVVDAALAELGIGGADDASPEERLTGLQRLSMMMATWEGCGIRVGFAFPGEYTDAAMSVPSGLPDGAVETVVAHLAMRLAPGYGKQVSPDTRATAKAGYDALLIDAARPRPQQLPDTLPMGAGNRLWPHQRTYFPTPTTDPLPVAPSGDLE